MIDYIARSRKKENKDEVGDLQRDKCMGLCGVNRGKDKGKHIFFKKIAGTKTINFHSGIPKIQSKKTITL